MTPSPLSCARKGSGPAKTRAYRRGTAGAFETTKGEMMVQSKETGPACICGARNMIHQGYRLYLCQACDSTMRLMFSSKQGFYCLPIRTALAIEASCVEP